MLKTKGLIVNGKIKSCEFCRHQLRKRLFFSDFAVSTHCYNLAPSMQNRTQGPVTQRMSCGKVLRLNIQHCVHAWATLPFVLEKDISASKVIQSKLRFRGLSQLKTEMPVIDGFHL